MRAYAYVKLKLLTMISSDEAPNMVIIEVAKNCPGVNQTLLGAHKWCEFLKKPEADQVELESRVFYCHHARSREVQKHGMCLHLSAIRPILMLSSVSRVEANRRSRQLVQQLDARKEVCIYSYHISQMGAHKFTNLTASLSRRPIHRRGTATSLQKRKRERDCVVLSLRACFRNQSKILLLFQVK